MIDKTKPILNQSRWAKTGVRQSDDDRRAYWAAQMDEADAFMRKIQTAPVGECGEPMLPLIPAVQAAGVEVVFSDKPHSEGLPRLFYLRQGLVPRFLAAAREMNDRGWILKVEDGYRTLTMQRGLSLKRDIFLAVLDKVRWESGQAVPPGDLLFRRLGALVANAPKVGTHMSGSAMDISVLNRDSGEEVDRGAPYLEMSELTPMGSPFVSASARETRGQITALMARHGFSTYPWEFWHYNADDAYAEELCRSGKPARYGAVHLDVATGQVRPVDDPNRLLHAQEQIRLLMEDVLGKPDARRQAAKSPTKGAG